MKFFDLEQQMYKHNKAELYQWLLVKWHWWWDEPDRWAIAFIGGILLSVYLMVAINGMTEIDTREYERLVSDHKFYSNRIPELAPMLAKAYEDGKVTENEYDDLQELKHDYWAEEERLERVEVKQALEKIVK